MAYELSKASLTNKSIENMEIPYSDFKHIKSNWNEKTSYILPN